MNSARNIGCANSYCYQAGLSLVSVKGYMHKCRGLLFSCPELDKANPTLAHRLSNQGLIGQDLILRSPAPLPTELGALLKADS